MPARKPHLRGTNTAVACMAPYCFGMRCPCSSSPPNSRRVPAGLHQDSLKRQAVPSSPMMCIVLQPKPCLGAPCKCAQAEHPPAFTARVYASPHQAGPHAQPSGTWDAQQAVLVCNHLLRGPGQHGAQGQVVQAAGGGPLCQRILQPCSPVGRSFRRGSTLSQHPSACSLWQQQPPVW